MAAAIPAAMTPVLEDAMDATLKLQVMRKLYAGVLADAVRQFHRAGCLEAVTAAKREEQLAAGKAQAAQLGITSVPEVFTGLADLVDCADWTVAEEGGVLHAQARRCLLCALAKRMGAPSPCRLYCLNPMEGMVRGVDPSRSFEVEETLYEGTRCSVRVR